MDQHRNLNGKDLHKNGSHRMNEKNFLGSKTTANGSAYNFLHLSDRTREKLEDFALQLLVQTVRTIKRYPIQSAIGAITFAFLSQSLSKKSNLKGSHR